MTADDGVAAAARSQATQRRFLDGASPSPRALLPAVAYEVSVRNGVALLSRSTDTVAVTLGLVNRLRDEPA